MQQKSSQIQGHIVLDLSHFDVLDSLKFTLSTAVRGWISYYVLTVRFKNLGFSQVGILSWGNLRTPNSYLDFSVNLVRNQWQEIMYRGWICKAIRLLVNWVLRACKPLLSYENISRSKIRGGTPCYVRKVERWITPYSGPRDFFDRIKVVYTPARPN